MGHPGIRIKIQLCTAAVCGALAFGASAQVAVDQARTAAGQNSIERAQGSGLQAGLERALKTPLEVVWLRTAAEADMWRDPTLASAVEACVKAGAPRAGCAVVGRTAFRYVFGGNMPFAPAPSEVARLVISSLNLPDAPVSTGRLALAGSGRLYLVTPETRAGERPTRGAVILAAGSTLQVSDAVSPSIQIELKAPANEPLLLGNLAAADVGRMLALLVKPGGPSASEASIDVRGRVALRSGGEVQLAAFVPATPVAAAVEPARRPSESQWTVASLAPTTALERIDAARGVRAAATPQVAPVVHIAGVEAGAAPSGNAVLLASLAPGMSTPNVSARASASAPATGLPQALATVAIGVQTVHPTASAPWVIASLAPAGLAAPVDVARAAQAPATQGPSSPALHIAGIETSAASRNDSLLQASLAPLVSAEGIAARPEAAAPARANVARASAAQPVLQIAAIAPRMEQRPAAEKPLQAASSAAPAAPSADQLARLRAEVEAEVAREQQRLAQKALQPRVIGTPKRFVLGV